MGAILITGGKGMIGSRLAALLSQQGKEVRILSRSPGPKEFYWNPKEKQIDSKALENIQTLIHLAGAPISKKWTKKYKNELYASRVDTADFLFQKIKESNHRPVSFISASGTNYYGTPTDNRVFRETDPPGKDYLGNLCGAWEKSAFRFEELGMRVCVVRTPAVLSSSGGMLGKLLPMAKWGLLSPLGNGRQIMPWVHIDDLCAAYIHLMQNVELKGCFNAAAPEVTDNRTFTQTLMKSVHRRILLPAVPGFVLRAALGEMAALLLEGNAISSEKIRRTGFRFKFDTLDKAFKNLLS